MTIASFAAHGLRTYAIPNLYIDKTENAVYLSTVTIRGYDLTKVAKIALNAPQAQPVRDAITGGQYYCFVLPTGMFVSEIPMHLPENKTSGQTVPDDCNRLRN